MGKTTHFPPMPGSRIHVLPPLYEYLLIPPPMSSACHHCVTSMGNIHTHTHTHLASSVVTSWLVTWQAGVRAALTVLKVFTDDRAVTVLLEQEDGVCSV